MHTRRKSSRALSLSLRYLSRLSPFFLFFFFFLPFLLFLRTWLDFAPALGFFFPCASVIGRKQRGKLMHHKQCPAVVIYTERPTTLEWAT